MAACPVCGDEFPSLLGLELHVEAHFPEPAVPHYDSVIPAPITRQNHDEHPTSPDLMPTLRLQPLSAQSTRHLASPHLTLHCSPPGTAKSRFDCGFRNIQTILSVLLHQRSPAAPTVRAALGERPDAIPTLPAIQRLIEQAWAAGFDPAGAAHFGGVLVGTTEWIGAVDVAALMCYLGVRAHIADFDPRKSNTRRGTHPALFNWCYTYFQRACTQTRSCCRCGGNAAIPPLYLQKDGHSVSIVGVERNSQNDIFLLIADPAPHFLDRVRKNPLSAVRTNVGALLDPQYQIVFIDVHNPCYNSKREQLEARIPQNVLDSDPARAQDLRTPGPDRAIRPVDVVDLT